MKFKNILPVMLLCAGTAQMSAAFNPSPIVTEPGQGQHSEWIRNTMAYTNIGGIMIFTERDLGGAVEMIESADGKVWLNFPISGIRVQGWLEGQREGSTITFPMPQEIYVEEGQTYSAALCESDSDGQYYASPRQQPLVLTDYAGNWRSQTDLDGKHLIGLCSAEGAFMGMGDYSYELMPFTTVAPEAPEGLKTERYAFVSKGTGHFINVGFDGQDAWIQGIEKTAPDNWVKAVRQGDTLSIPSGSYLGILGNPSYTPHYLYLMAATPDNSPAGFTIEDEYTFTLQDGSVWGSDGYYILNTMESPEEINYIGFVKMPSMWEQNDSDVAMTPNQPATVNYYPGAESFNFILDQMSDNGKLLDADYFYYKIYVDGEPYTLTRDEYKYLDAPEMEEIPYEYTEDYDINAGDNYREVYVYFEDAEVIGVQAIYYGGGEERCSDIVNSDGTVTPASSAVKALEAAKPHSPKVFDLQGRRTNATKGLRIEEGKLRL